MLADKIIYLRKKNGWSQEELAEKLNISRQSVSKWESGQSVPDLNKIIILSNLFDVTTDYLLKDNVEDTNNKINAKYLTFNEILEFIECKNYLSKLMAGATFLCIISPCCLLVLLSLNTFANIAVAIGLSVMMILIAIACGIFIYCDEKNKRFDYFNHESIMIEQSTIMKIRQLETDSHSDYVKYNIIGTILCILAVIPLFLGIITEDGWFILKMIALLLFIVGIGVIYFIIASNKQESIRLLLKKDENKIVRSKDDKIKDTVASVYWLIITVIYLGYSFFTNAWKYSWIIWVLAGIIYAIIDIIMNTIFDRGDSY